jgi:hypothetical protein
MMNMRIALAAIIAGALAGCATTPPPEVLRTADYGSYPGNFESVIKDYVAGQLKDPGSAQYQFLNAPKKGYWGLGGAKYGYVVCARINAKNSFGGYTGAKMNYFMIRDGSIIDASLSAEGPYGEIMPTSKCKPYI